MTATTTQAWATIAAGEDAAVYAYGLAGARLTGRERDRARTALEHHRQARDRAAAAAQGAAAPPAVEYELPVDPRSAKSARALLASVENALVPAYAAAAAAQSATDRRRPAREASECAVRAIGWGASPEAFPS